MKIDKLYRYIFLVRFNRFHQDSVRRRHMQAQGCHVIEKKQQWPFSQPEYNIEDRFAFLEASIAAKFCHWLLDRNRNDF